MSASLDEKLAKLKELAGDPDLLATLLAGVERTEKAADAAGVRYKEAGAGGAAEDDEGASVETKAEGDEATADAEMDEAAAEDDAAGSILEDADLAAIADAVAAKLAPMFEGLAAAATTKGTTAVPDALQRALDGFLTTTKAASDAAAQAQQIAAAAAAKADKAAPADEITRLKERLAELEGDQPRGVAGGYRASGDQETVKETGKHAAPAEDEMIKAANWLVG